MARYSEAISITFNDNDGGVCWSVNPNMRHDVLRHYKIFGKWRARWIFFKAFWRAMICMEQISLVNCDKRKIKLWVFKSVIPE